MLSKLLLTGHDPEHPLDSIPNSKVNKVFKEVTKRILTYHAERKKQQFKKEKIDDKKQKKEDPIIQVIDKIPLKHWLPQNTEEEYFDVFLCHNSKDNSEIRDIGKKLKKTGIIPWLNEWNLRPGDSWIEVLEKQIDSIKTAIVFIGSDGIGPWQDLEIQGFLLKLAEKKCRIIPVILQGCKSDPEVPMFLEAVMWVDFRKSEPDPFGQLLFGITGKRQGD